MRAPSLPFVAAMLLAAGCQKVESKAVAAASPDLAVSQANCAGELPTAQLKVAAFARARALGKIDDAALDRIAAGSGVTLKDAGPRGWDDALRATICVGKLVVQLPPGTVDRFDGATAIEAPVEYTVQRVDDVGARVLPISGGDAVVYRLAALALPETQAIETLGPPPAGLPPPQPQPATFRPAVMTREVYVPVPTPPKPQGRCAAPRDHVERMLCDNAGLAALDRNAAEYQRRVLAVATPETREKLIRTQNKTFDRLRRCQRLSCAEDVYEDRIEQIERIARRN